MSVEFSAIINFINYFVFIFRNKPSDLLIRKPATLLYASGVSKIIFLFTLTTTGSIFSKKKLSVRLFRISSRSLFLLFQICVCLCRIPCSFSAADLPQGSKGSYGKVMASCSFIFHGSSRCTPYGRTPLTEFRTCGFPASGSLRNESFTLSFVYIDIYPGSYQWIAVIQHI